MLPAAASVANLCRGGARRAPERAAIEWDGGEISFAALDRRTESLARHFQDSVEPGRRVGLYCANRVEWIEAYVAAHKAGIPVVPINHRYRSREVEHIVGRGRPRARRTRRHGLRRRSRPGCARLRRDARRRRRLRPCGRWLGRACRAARDGGGRARVHVRHDRASEGGRLHARHAGDLGVRAADGGRVRPLRPLPALHTARASRGAAPAPVRALHGCDDPSPHRVQPRRSRLGDPRPRRHGSRRRPDGPEGHPRAEARRRARADARRPSRLPLGGERRLPPARGGQLLVPECALQLRVREHRGGTRDVPRSRGSARAHALVRPRAAGGRDSPRGR